MTDIPAQAPSELAAKALFESTAKAKGFVNHPPWEELHDDTKRLYRDKIAERTQAPTDSAVPPGPAQGEPAGVSELDAVIELVQARVSGAVFNGIKAFEHEPRRILAVLLAARQELAATRTQLAEMRAERDNNDTRRLMFITHNYKRMNFWGMADDDIRAAIDVAIGEEASPSQPIVSATLQEAIKRCPHRTPAECDCEIDPVRASQPERGNPGTFSQFIQMPADEKAAVMESVMEKASAAQNRLLANCAQGGSPADPERQASPALREAEHVLTQQERDGLHRAHQRSVVTIDPPPVSAALREAAKAGAMMLQNYCAQLPADHPWQAQAALLNAFAEGK